MPINLSGSLVLTGSLTVTGEITMSGSIASASYAVNATSASFAGDTVLFANRASATFANTGSNTFVGTQTITGSVLQSGSLSVNGCITSTGQIIAQTINVQQVTSSIVYSCGSNIFGSAIGNTQVLTGSVSITGSLNTIGNTCVTSICSPSIIGGTVNGTTGTFSSCVVANGGVRTTGANGFSDTDGTSTIWMSANWTASTPAIAVTTNHPLMFLTNNTERMRITSGGAVGIGSNAPVIDDGNLVVAGCAGTGQGITCTTAQINIWETTSGNKAGLWFGAVNCANVGVIGSRTATGNIAFQTYCGAWGERMRITYNGNILVGTPSDLGLTTGGILQVNSPWGMSITNGGQALRLFRSGVNTWEFGQGTFTTQTGFGLTDATASRTALFIQQSTGNTGIGTTSPATNLDVIAFPRNSCLATLRIGTQCHGGTGDEFANLEFYWGDPDAAEVKAKIYGKITGNVGPGGGGAGDLLFATTPAFGSSTERMRITSTGQLGIGTTCTSTEANLFLGGLSSTEGGQLVLQKATSFQCASHIDNYSNQFRILSGDNIGTNAAHMIIDHTTKNACFYGAVTSTSRVIGNGFRSYSGEISIASGATSTIYTMADNGLYTVQAIVAGGSLIYSAAAIFYAHNSNAQYVKTTDLYDGANVALDNSGSSIRITNGGFTTLTWNWSIIFQAF